MGTHLREPKPSNQARELDAGDSDIEIISTIELSDEKKNAVTRAREQILAR